MKIKHWAGYGCLNAKRLKNDGNDIVIEITGDHEQGILPREWFEDEWYAKIAKRFRINYKSVTTDFLYANSADKLLLYFEKEV